MGCTLTTEEVAHIDRTIAKLKSENDGYAGQLTRLTYEAELLRRENAKLRELVRDYEHCTMYADCAHCKYDGKLSTHCPLSPCFPDTDELRELGVEVDE